MAIQENLRGILRAIEAVLPVKRSVLLVRSKSHHNRSPCHFDRCIPTFVAPPGSRSGVFADVLCDFGLRHALRGVCVARNEYHCVIMAGGLDTETLAEDIRSRGVLGCRW